MPYKWSQFDEKGLAALVHPELPKSFSLPDRVNRTELLQWKQYHQLAEEIYNALIAKNIKYALEPENNESNVQLIRTPEEILEIRKEGTCLDLAVLYCGLCLGFGLLPLLIVLRKHALVAVSLHYSRQEYWEAATPEREQERNLFQKEPLKDVESFRNLLRKGRFMAIECTGFAHTETALSESQPEGVERQKDGTLTFERAIAAGEEQLYLPDRPLEFALDIAIAHQYWKIKQDVVYPNPRLSEPSRLGNLEQIITSGYQLLEDKQFDKAEETFDLARKLYKKAPEPWLGKAHVTFAQGNTSVALQFVNKSLKQNPNYWQGLAFKIKLLLLLGGNYREEAMKLSTESRGLSTKLDVWLDCLTKQGIFTQLLVTDSVLDSLCLFPKYYE
jgi:tetratricopeptide (TPR) repeat protein